MAKIDIQFWEQTTTDPSLLEGFRVAFRHAEIVWESNPDSYPEFNQLECMQGCVLVVGYLGGKPVTTAVLSLQMINPSMQTLYLHAVATHSPDHRNGYATTLLKEIRLWAIRKECKLIRLNINIPMTEVKNNDSEEKRLREESMKNRIERIKESTSQTYLLKWNLLM